jgi:hypothetical protein
MEIRDLLLDGEQQMGAQMFADASQRASEIHGTGFIKLTTNVTGIAELVLKLFWANNNTMQIIVVS